MDLAGSETEPARPAQARHRAAHAELRAEIEQQLHPPFRRQLDNAETVARLTEEQKLWQARADAITPENARAIFSRLEEIDRASVRPARF